MTGCRGPSWRLRKFRTPLVQLKTAHPLSKMTHFQELALKHFLTLWIHSSEIYYPKVQHLYKIFKIHTLKSVYINDLTSKPSSVLACLSIGTQTPALQTRVCIAGYLARTYYSNKSCERFSAYPRQWDNFCP